MADWGDVVTSYLRGMLRRVRTRAVIATVTAGSLCVAALVIARTMLRPAGLVPQLDNPLRRDTDMPQSPDATALGGAILGLAFSADETTARYWLSQCARRGATWEQQRDLWDGWRALNPGPSEDL